MNQKPEKKEMTAIIIASLLLGVFDFVFGIYALICYDSISSELVHVGDKLNQAGVDALIRMEKDFTLLCFSISMVLICNSVLIFLLISQIKRKMNP
jgi:uncharacterized membrane protein